MKALDTVGKYLFYILIIDFSLESLDQIHRIYEAEESFDILSLLVSSKLYITLFGMQILMGMIIPMLSLGLLQVAKIKEQVRKYMYAASGLLVLMGIFFMRWNVVIGGQLFSKSFLGFTSFNISPFGAEGFMMAVFWMILPFIVLAFLLWLMPPWKKQDFSE